MDFIRKLSNSFKMFVFLHKQQPNITGMRQPIGSLAEGGIHWVNPQLTRSLALTLCRRKEPCRVNLLLGLFVDLWEGKSQVKGIISAKAILANGLQDKWQFNLLTQQLKSMSF